MSSSSKLTNKVLGRYIFGVGQSRFFYLVIVYSTCISLSISNPILKIQSYNEIKFMNIINIESVIYSDNIIILKLQNSWKCECFFHDRLVSDNSYLLYLGILSFKYYICLKATN